MFRFVATSAILATTLSVAALAEPLQPVEKWAVDYGETQCIAARTFGTATDPVILGIIPAVNGQSYEILISRERAGPVYAKDYRGSVDFGAGAIPTTLLFYGAKGVNRSNYQYRLSAADIERARGASSVTFATGDRQRMSFALSDMAPVLDGLRKCNADLQSYWNMGRPPATPLNAPSGDLKRLLNAGDYPPTQTRFGQGTSQFQLLVDEKGVVQACDVLSRSDNPAFESAGCAAFKARARFKPAMDAQGKPVRSIFTTSPVSWQRQSETALDSGCTRVSDDGRTLISQCDENASGMRGRFPSYGISTEPTRPPPPPPPAK